MPESSYTECALLHWKKNKTKQTLTNAIKKATDKFEYLSLKALGNLSNFFKSLKGILLLVQLLYFSQKPLSTIVREMLHLQIPKLDISQFHYQDSHCLTLLNSFTSIRLLITCDPLSRLDSIPLSLTF